MKNPQKERGRRKEKRKDKGVREGGVGRVMRGEKQRREGWRGWGWCEGTTAPAPPWETQPSDTLPRSHCTLRVRLSRKRSMW